MFGQCGTHADVFIVDIVIVDVAVRVHVAGVVVIVCIGRTQPPIGANHNLIPICKSLQ